MIYERNGFRAISLKKIDSFSEERIGKSPRSNLDSKSKLLPFPENGEENQDIQHPFYIHVNLF